MQGKLSRRGFLGAVPAGCGVVAILGTWPSSVDAAEGPSGETAARSNDGLPSSFPRQDADAVSETVRVAHFDLEKVRELVTARPALAKTAWDWGFGDWESAIGAASHMGRRDIVEVLMKHGARPTMFTFTMLGNLEVVRSMVKAHPGIQRIHGPHGFTLLAHAKAGGSASEPVVEYLRSLGDADVGQTGLAVPDQEREAVLGVYAFGAGETERLEVLDRRGDLGIKRVGDPFRNLIRVGSYEYHPTGAPAVRVKFEMTGGSASALTLVDAERSVRARRLA